MRRLSFGGLFGRKAADAGRGGATDLIQPGSTGSGGGDAIGGGAAGTHTPAANEPLTVYVDGSWPFLHAGHFHEFQHIKEVLPNASLVVGVCGDDETGAFYMTPIQPHEQKVATLQYLKNVDRIIDAPWVVTPEWLDRHNIHTVVLTPQSNTLRRFSPEFNEATVKAIRQKLQADSRVIDLTRTGALVPSRSNSNSAFGQEGDPVTNETILRSINQSICSHIDKLMKEGHSSAELGISGLTAWQIQTIMDLTHPSPEMTALIDWAFPKIPNNITPSLSNAPVGIGIFPPDAPEIPTSTSTSAAAAAATSASAQQTDHPAPPPAPAPTHTETPAAAASTSPFGILTSMLGCARRGSRQHAKRIAANTNMIPLKPGNVVDEEEAVAERENELELVEESAEAGQAGKRKREPSRRYGTASTFHTDVGASVGALASLPANHVDVVMEDAAVGAAIGVGVGIAVGGSPADGAGGPDKSPIVAPAAGGERMARLSNEQRSQKKARTRDVGAGAADLPQPGEPSAPADDPSVINLTAEIPSSYDRAHHTTTAEQARLRLDYDDEAAPDVWGDLEQTGAAGIGFPEGEGEDQQQHQWGQPYQQTSNAAAAAAVAYQVKVTATLAGTAKEGGAPRPPTDVEGEESYPISPPDAMQTARGGGDQGAGGGGESGGGSVNGHGDEGASSGEMDHSGGDSVEEGTQQQDQQYGGEQEGYDDSPPPPSGSEAVRQAFGGFAIDPSAADHPAQLHPDPMPAAHAHATQQYPYQQHPYQQQDPYQYQQYQQQQQQYEEEGEQGDGEGEGGESMEEGSGEYSGNSGGEGEQSGEQSGEPSGQPSPPDGEGEGELQESVGEEEEEESGEPTPEE
ncbi:unnamed protein product [Vitrella brassicaformis CCMP3155]|uniref:choline-phosphate cytidylyltransferase n=2 Tax=Vitrella brassicaformis TaxID=1169539 RepID=A0A0G4GZD1_VITBC|nr:unnamed protein product [Vitrella brassicaformis CCMP3155]|eukprot:CEM36343.1 unnamed protein product [Vitrella brassicaformis CCMP3155]